MRKTAELLCEYLKGVDDNKKRKTRMKIIGSAEIKRLMLVGV